MGKETYSFQDRLRKFICVLDYLDMVQIIQPMIKGLKRCPTCNSSRIYKRTRIVQIKREIRKRNGKQKMYICKDCKYEFDQPIII